jgi:hypothetical protein
MSTHTHRHGIDFIFMQPALAPSCTHFFSLADEHPALAVLFTDTRYFSDPKHLEKGQDWYEAHFPKVPRGVKRGEVSTSYLTTPAAAAAIAKQYPDAHIAALIMNPLESVYTAYSQKAAQTQPLSIESWLETAPLVLPSCKLAGSLSEFFVYYSPVDCLVLTLDEVRENPSQAIRRLYTHLEVDPTYVPKVLRVLAEDEKKFGLLARHLRLDRLHKRRRQQRLSKAHQQFLAPTMTMTDRERRLLARYFDEEVTHLSALLNRNLKVEWDWPGV